MGFRCLKLGSDQWDATKAKDKDFVRGRGLFDDPAYLYQAILTNRTDAPEDIRRFYRKHAGIENQIRELKWDYGTNGFCQKKFFATEAAFPSSKSNCGAVGTG